jgi:pimeloyl-ACP methyl ester carboxylesterase
MPRRSAGLAMLVIAAAVAQEPKAGPQVLTFFSAIDDSDQPYGLYLPNNYDSGKKYPLVVSLHGAYSNHRLNLRRVFGQGNRMGETDMEASRYFPALADVDFIVATPLARGTMGYQGIAERDVYDVLGDVRSKFSIDEDRIYLTGLSMGGGGTLWLGLTRPDLWAAIAPVCPYPPAGTGDLAGNALNIPVKMFQGERDPVVSPESVRQWQKLFTDAGVRSEYVEFPGVRHNAWDYAYKGAAIFGWFKQFRRERFPERVRFAARDYAHTKAYWVRFDRLTPGTTAGIDARLNARNSIVITTENTAGVSLLLNGHPMVSRKQMVSISIDGQKLRSRWSESISLARTGTVWSLQRLAPSAGEKRPGAEGPIADALSARHMYVYGTADGAAPDEIERRRAEAAYAAEWSTRQSRLLLTFRTVADAEVKDTELDSSNLVLFGTRETNSIIARLSSKLPISLNPGAADYSLTYVYPIDTRYVIINSGLPWWTRADQAQRPGMSFINLIYRTALSFGDFIVFRGGLENVVTEGRFTNDWSLPEGAAEKMRATAAIEIAPRQDPPVEAPKPRPVTRRVRRK